MRLIDGDVLKTEVENMVLRREGFHENDYEYGRNQALDYVSDILIDDAPTIDAVEVVRCKDCETIDENGWCEFVNGYVHDGFCAWGKRKGGEDE